jgi:hypothetical protein
MPYRRWRLAASSFFSHFKRSSSKRSRVKMALFASETLAIKPADISALINWVVISVAGVAVITVMIFSFKKLIKICQICRENNFVQHKMDFISFAKK